MPRARARCPVVPSCVPLAVGLPESPRPGCEGHAVHAGHAGPGNPGGHESRVSVLHPMPTFGWRSVACFTTFPIPRRSRPCSPPFGTPGTSSGCAYRARCSHLSPMSTFDVLRAAPMHALGRPTACSMSRMRGPSSPRFPPSTARPPNRWCVHPGGVMIVPHHVIGPDTNIMRDEEDHCVHPVAPILPTHPHGSRQECGLTTSYNGCRTAVRAPHRVVSGLEIH